MMSYVKQTTRTRRFTVSSDCPLDICVGGDDDPAEQSITIRCRSGTMHTPMLHTGKFIDMTDLRSMARDIVRGRKTPRARVEAIHDFCHPDRLWHWPPPPDQENPVKLMLGYGYGFCSVHSYLFHELCAAAGLKSVRLSVGREGEGSDPHKVITGYHSVNEVYYEGGWRFYDSDLDCFYENEKGNAAGAATLKKRTDLLDRSADEYGMNPTAGPVAPQKNLYSHMKVERSGRVVDHPCNAEFSLGAGSSIRLDLKPLEDIVDTTRLIPPWEMDQHPVFNTGSIALRIRKQDIRENVLRVKVPYILLSACLSDALLECFRSISVSRDGQVWRRLRGRTIRFDDDPMEYYLKLEGQRRAPGAGCIIENRVQFNSLVVPFLRRGPNRIHLRTKGREPFTAELVFRWKERSVKRAHRKRATSIRWSEEAPLCDLRGVESRAVSATVDPGGTVWSTFQAKKGDKCTIRYGFLGEKGWCFEEIGGGPRFYADFPDILVDSAGIRHVVFQTGTPVEGSDILYVNSDSPDELVKVNTRDPWGFSWFPKLAENGGRVVAAWQGPDTSAARRKPFEGRLSIWVKDLAKRGRSVRYDGYYGLLCLPSIAADSRGRFHVVFVYQGVDYREMEADLSSTLSAASIFPYPSDYGFGSDVVTDKRDNVYAVWSARNYGTRPNVFLRERRKGKWAECVRLSEGDFSDSQYPSIAVGGDGRIHVVWMDNRSGKWVVFYKRFDGRDWGPDCPLSDPKRNARSPKVVVGRDDLPVVFWNCSERGKNRAFYRRAL